MIRQRQQGMRRGVAAVALTVGMIAASLTVGAASADASSTRSKPDGETTHLVHFRLDPTNGQQLSPNRPNFAQHAETPGPLLVFLPATGARPSDYRSFLKTAVSSGYDVLGLDYWNRGRSVVRTCGGDAECYTRVQQNRFDGTDPSPVSDVDPENSILNRLTLALRHLKTTDPKGDWGRYLSDGQVDWSRIVLAGHSQGGGESAYISHLHRVHGVLMYSSPVESTNGVPAAWMTTPGATPASAMWGFVNQHDLYSDKIVGSWKALGMEAEAPSVTSAVPTGSHELISSLDVGTPLDAHDKTVGDRTPRASDGTPLYEPTWKWMLRKAL